MMYKLGAIFLFFWIFIPIAGAQLPAGSNAPDFTVTDINGQTHHLYDVLDSNKIVVLEISATWCPPCWAYHQGGALQDFYAVHGPAGDNKARVFWVEGDPNTNLACIYGQSGCNNNSAGNYAAGTPYPILNNAAIATAFEITYFPSLFIICPNKRAYEVDPLSATGLWDKAQVCPVANGTNNAGMFAHDPGYDLPEICGTVDLSPTFMLTNLGSLPLTSASIFLKWNGSTVQTIDWQGALPTYGEAPIHFNSFEVNSAGTLNTVISSINNNAGDDDFTNNYKNNIFTTAVHFAQTRVVLKIRTDDYANETYWELRDDAGNVLEHGGNQLVGPNGGGAFPLGTPAGPGTYSSNTLIKDTLELPAAGCYSIHFVDGFGDGMCCNYGNGYYKLYNITNPTTPLIVSGQFDEYDRHAFEAGSLSANQDLSAPTLDLVLFPNPATDRLYVDIDTDKEESLNLEVFNGLGQIVVERRTAHLASGSNTIEVPLETVPNGLYFLAVRRELGFEMPTLRKFVVRR